MKFKNTYGLNMALRKRPILKKCGVTSYVDLKKDNVFINYEGEEDITFIVSDKGMVFYTVHAYDINGKVEIDLVIFGSSALKFMNEKMRESL